ncbi:glycosyltransferase family 4 protein [Hymenobacter sp. BT188]|uniref:glycosyltransferase family 4 protein n=1 Tax=Hymenobacter sp. BT188 TaxID=2763504 RepID=UPI00165103F3|nr:glycosyltransferase family 4 protein [Hymenobacter sp. BT188]MBC6607160.1 glycosyltransferase family 4 protein [Hymenobacter sp. BT188]
MMSYAKWNVEEIEHTRIQLNNLQQQLEKYTSTKKLGLAFVQAVLWGVKRKFSSFTTSDASQSEPATDFFAKNPDFKSYQIKLKTPLSTHVPKILHVIPYFITGGSQQLVVDLIEGLSDQYVHEVVLLAKHSEQGYVGVTTHDCSTVRDPQDFTALLNTIKPNIVHVHYYGRYVELRGGIKWPYAFWQWYHAIFQGTKAYGCPIIENCNIPFMPYFDAGITRYVYVSKYAQDTYGVRDMPNQVVYPGSNFSFFQRNGIQPDPDTIGMVYRLDHDKLNERAIEPFIRTVEKRPTTKVLIVGGGEFLELFRNKVTTANLQSQFTFTGYVAYEKLVELYQKMAVFVAPVHSESFGQVTPFAMNMGIAVAAYNIGALEEMLVMPEVLAPGDDAEELSDIIVNLLNDSSKREKIGAFNASRAAELFTVETMVKAYREIYQSLVL